MSKYYCLLWEKGTWFLFESNKLIRGIYPGHTYKLYATESDRNNILYDELKEVQRVLISQNSVPTINNKRKMFPRLETLLKNKK